MPLIRLAMAGRAAARRQAYRGLIRGLEQPPIAALDQFLIDRSGDRSHLGWIAEAPEGDYQFQNVNGFPVVKMRVVRL